MKLETVKELEFDDKFQEKLLACMLKITSFNAVASQYVQQHHFTGTIYKNIAKTFLDYHREFGGCISDYAYLEIIGLKFNGDKENLMAHIEMYGKLRRVDVTDSDFVLHKLIEFIKVQSWKGLIEDSVKRYLDDGRTPNLKALESEATKIINISAINKSEGYDYFSEVNITERAESRRLALTAPRGVSTGIRDLDLRLANRGFSSKELTIILASAKKGKCITKSTMCFTEDGLVEIGDYIPDTLAVDSFQEKKIKLLGIDGIEATSHIYNSGLTPTKRIITSTGVVLEGTYNHPIMTIKKGEFEWCELDALQVGDWVVSKKGQMIFGNKTDLQYAVNAGWQRKTEYQRNEGFLDKVTLPNIMTVELAEFMAMFIAEGHCGTQSSIQFTKSNKVMMKHYVDIFSNLFGITPHHQPKRKNCAMKQSPIIRAFLEATGVKWTLSKDKEIPRAILQAPEKCVKAFLSVLLGIEGSVIKTNKSTVSFEITMASEKIIRQIQMLLLNYGIVAQVELKCACATNGSRIVRDYWRLRISGRENIMILKESIGLFDSVKNDKLIAQDKDSTCRSFIPESREIMQSIMSSIKVSHKIIDFFNESERSMMSAYANSNDESRKLTISFAKRIVERLNNKGIESWGLNRLNSIINGNFIFAKVKNISDSEAITVDFTVPITHSFVGNGIVNHNSFCLLWFANAAAQAGKNVVYFTLENSRQVCTDRLDALNTGVLYNDLAINENVVPLLKAKSLLGNIRIYEYPTKSCAISQIEQHLITLEKQEAFRADILLVDYLDLLKNPLLKEEDSLIQQATNTENLRGLAGKFNIPVVTASQINRAGTGKSINSGVDIAGSIGKVQIADQIICLSSTDDEARNKELKIVLSESRNNGSGVIKIKTAYERGCFFDKVIGMSD